MFTKFESYNRDIEPNLGDILIIDKNNKKKYVYFFENDVGDVKLFSYHRQELVTITMGHLLKTIENKQTEVRPVEKVFEMDPDLVVQLYKGISQLILEMLDAPHTQLTVKICKDIKQSWFEKCPDLEFLLTADNYNL